MPDYNLTLTIPANTSKDKPVEEELILTKGVIAGGQIFFPFGCVGMVHVTINDSSGQLYPANKDDTFHGEGYNIPLIGRYKLDTTPYKLVIRGWSPDTIHEHKAQIHLSILTEEEMSPYLMLKDFLSVFKRILGIP